jgi:hypothetical protein
MMFRKKMDLVFENALSKTWLAWEEALRMYLFWRICFPNPSLLSKVVAKLTVESGLISSWTT